MWDPRESTDRCGGSYVRYRVLAEWISDGSREASSSGSPESAFSSPRSSFPGSRRTRTIPNAQINGERGEFNAFDTYGSLDWLLVAACAAPFILAWIVVRGHKLTWRPGEITMIVGMTAFALIILNGVILGRPGDPDSEISIRIGYFVGLFGSALICVGGIIRQAEGERARKPPGTV